MKLLLLGGTGFVGRHLVEQALARGHTVTLFNRGMTAPNLFPNVETIIGDREKSVEPLRGRTWDAVIDTNARSPRLARAAAKALKSQVRHYSFISSISVYADLFGGEIDEGSPVSELDAHDLDDQGSRTYGARKALCERWIREEVGDGLLVLRPGLIVGPGDATDRFTYWPVRVAQGGDVVAPGDGSDLVRFIDVRDLAAWTIRMVEAERHGVFNAAGPDYPLTIKGLLDACVAVCSPGANLTWMATEFLTEHGVSPWSDMPVWAPGLCPLSIAKAKSAGLTFTPLRQTIADTLAWANDTGTELPLKAGLSREREGTVLAAWRAAQKNADGAPW